MPDSIVLFSLVQNILANDSFRNCTLTNKGGVPFDQQNLSEILEKERLIECSVGFVIIGCMLANEKALSLSSKDVRVLLRWLIKFGGEKIGICNSYSSDILLWKLKNSFSNLLSIEQRKEMSLECDSPEDMYLLNMSVGFLNQVKGNIRSANFCTDIDGSEKHIFFCLPVELSYIDEQNRNIDGLVDWDLCALSNRIVSSIYNRDSLQTNKMIIETTFSLTYKVSELQYLLWILKYRTSESITSLPAHRLHLNFRRPSDIEENLLGEFGDALSKVLWLWAAPMTSSFFSNSLHPTDISRAFCLKLSWERALAATVLLPRCNFSAQCKLPLDLIATETARFLCQINCSRVMLRAASDSGKGDRKDKANRDFEVEEELISLHCKLLDQYLNFLLVSLSDDAFLSTISYLSPNPSDEPSESTRDGFESAKNSSRGLSGKPLSENIRTDVGLAVVAAFLYKIFRIEAALAEPFPRCSSVERMVQETFLDHDIDWKLNYVDDTDKVSLARCCGWVEEDNLEVMANFLFSDRQSINEIQRFRREHFRKCLDLIPVLFVQIDLTRRCYLPLSRTTETLGSQLDSCGQKIFIFILLSFLESELRSLDVEGQLRDDNPDLTSLSNNLILSFLNVLASIESTVTSSALCLDKSYNSLYQFANDLEKAGYLNQGIRGMYAMLECLVCFTQDSCIAIAGLRIMKLLAAGNGFESSLRTLCWSMVRELYTEATYFNTGLVGRPGIDALLHLIANLTSADEVFVAAISELSELRPRSDFPFAMELLETAFDSSKAISKKNCAVQPLQSFLTIWMYWWTSEPPSSRIYGVLFIVREIFRCFLLDEESRLTSASNAVNCERLMSVESNTEQVGAAAQRQIEACAFPTLSRDSLMFHLKLSLSMIPTLIALCESQQTGGRSHDRFVTSCKLAVTIYGEFEFVAQEKEEHMWVVLEIAPFLTKHSRAICETINNYLDKAIEWNHVSSMKVGEGSDQKSEDCCPTVQLQEVLQWSFCITLSIISFWRIFDGVVVKSGRYDIPKNLRSMPVLQQACDKLAAKLVKLADAFSVELLCMDVSTNGSVDSWDSELIDGLIEFVDSNN